MAYSGAPTLIPPFVYLRKIYPFSGLQVEVHNSHFEPATINMALPLPFPVPLPYSVRKLLFVRGRLTLVSYWILEFLLPLWPKLRQLLALHPSTSRVIRIRVAAFQALYHRRSGAFLPILNRLQVLGCLFLECSCACICFVCCCMARRSSPSFSEFRLLETGHDQVA